MKISATFAMTIVFLAVPVTFAGGPNCHNGAIQSHWTRAIDTGLKTWPRWVKPIANGSDALLMVAEDGTWCSSDGIEWAKVSNNAHVAVRPGATQVFFKDKFWLMGGMNDWSEFTNEVYPSADGAKWRRVTDKAPWPPRRDALLAVFNDRLWLFSGSESSGRRDVTPTRWYRDAWQSEDGLKWKRLSTILPENAEQVLVFRNQLWLLGKAGAWSSSDGVTWSRRSSGDPLNERGGYGAVVYHNRIWIFGGIANGNVTNEVWSTVDGRIWVREDNAPWFTRGGEYSIVFVGKLWFYGGKK